MKARLFTLFFARLRLVRASASAHEPARSEPRPLAEFLRTPLKKMYKSEKTLAFSHLLILLLLFPLLLQAQSTFEKGKIKKRKFHYSGFALNSSDSIHTDGVYVRNSIDAVTKEPQIEYVRFFRDGKIFISAPVKSLKPDSVNYSDLSRGTCTYFWSEGRNGIYVKMFSRKIRYHLCIAKYTKDEIHFTGYKKCRHCEFHKSYGVPYNFRKMNLRTLPDW